MTRVSTNYLTGSLQFGMAENRLKLAKYTEEISSGFKVSTPGDTGQPGLIAGLREFDGRMQSHLDRMQTLSGGLEFQESVLGESENVIQRALELATQGANGTYTPESRAKMAEEVFGLRDQLVSLANSTYQGTYPFGGNRDDQPPFVLQSPPYSNPATGPGSQRYGYTSAPGADGTRSVELSDAVSVRVNSVGSGVFGRAIEGLERLGRTLAGYQTNPPVTSPSSPPSPDGTGVAYTFPADAALQAQDIRQTIDILKSASSTQLGAERSSLGARLNQLQSAKSVVEVAKLNARESLSGLQDTDVAESATSLSQARIALEATMSVSGQVLRLTILDYL